MFSLLLALIYMAFISLGLPDALLGAAWPVMVEEFAAPLSHAGIISMIISGGTIVSSLFSDKMTRRLSAGQVTALSVLLTAVALLGFSLSGKFWHLCLCAIPYGLGAGAVDAALNNYVALHYSGRHMSWLHCFWGVGATLGPYVMSGALALNYGWRMGYGAIAVLQFALTAVLFCSLPLWKKRQQQSEGEEGYEAPLGLWDAVKIQGVKAILLAFFGYCALESTAGLWAASYLVNFRGVDAETAAAFASFFYIGITIGRFVSGFVTDRLGDKKMIRLGIAVMGAGLALILLPLPTAVLSLAGLVVVGLGCAPIYPAIIHSTPSHFGRENSHAIVGIQMACAYCGATFMPPMFGLVAQYIHIGLFPVFMAVFALLQFAMTERVNRVCNQQRKPST